MTAALATGKDRDHIAAPLTSREAERLVVVARRNKKHACRGMKQQRLVELKAAVNAALLASIHGGAR